MSTALSSERTDWEMVIGLEVHVQLATQSKLFSGASTTFGAEPNTQVSMVDLGLPGVLPVVNTQAIEMAIRFGLAINAEICRESEFARKNYFYPDLPKGYQTTQMDHPIIQKGSVPITLPDGSARLISIHHAHLEEDAGKSIHDSSTRQSKIDLNRAGVPLLEIVTDPDFRSSEEVVAYLKYLNTLVRYLKISDGDLSQGSMRCDVNLSMRPRKQKILGTRTELKNLNSYRFIEQAIAVESERHMALLDQGQPVLQETRLYNPDRNETSSMRSKEDAQDYRYFPCPDLLPVLIEEHTICRIRKELPELPADKLNRYTNTFKLTPVNARRLTDDPDSAHFFEQMITLNTSSESAVNWLLGEVAAYLKETKSRLSKLNLTPAQLANIIEKQKEGTLSGHGAKKLFHALCKGSYTDIDEAISSMNLRQVSDSGQIENFVRKVIEDNPGQVQNYLNAPDEKKGRMLGFFTGQVMKASKGTANPTLVNQILSEKLKNNC